MTEPENNRVIEELKNIIAEKDRQIAELVKENSMLLERIQQAKKFLC